MKWGVFGMSESQASTAAAGEQNNEQGKEEAKAFEAITSQEDFDKAIQTRIARERAKIPTDYDDLKAQAAKYAVWEESQKTETQKQADRLAEIEAENSGLRSAQTRAEVAEAKSDPEKGIIVPAALLTGSTREELEASADALIAFRGDQQPQRLHVPNEGLAPTGDDNPSSQFASFMKTQLGQ